MMQALFTVDAVVCAKKVFSALARVDFNHRERSDEQQVCFLDRVDTVLCHGYRFASLR